MKKIGTYLLAVTLLLSLVACAPKRYERKHAPVGTSSIKKSSGEKSSRKKKSQIKMIKKPLGPYQKQTKRISIRSLKTVRL